MERLTKQGVTYGSYEFIDDGIHEWINRLSAYEDTGLTPEEITTLKEELDISRSEVQGLSRRLIELQADRDYWKAEALKHCAKLGEIKILIEIAYE